MSTIRDIYAHFLSRTNRMVVVYNTEFNSVDASNRLLDISRDSQLLCLVRLQHLWGEFWRELLYRSSLGGCHTTEGKYLHQVVSINNSRDFYAEISKLSSGRRYVAWHVPMIVANIVRGLSPDNGSQIVTALSSVSPAEDILSVRNYIVHPNKETRVKFSSVAQKFGIFDSDPAVLLSDKIFPSNVTRFEDWVIQLQIVALNAVR